MNKPKPPETPIPGPDSPLSSPTNSLELIFHPGGHEQNSQTMKRWIDDLIKISKYKLNCTAVALQEQPYLPALGLQLPGRSSIHYHFVPQGKELSPFEDLIHHMAQAKQLPSAESSPERLPPPPLETLLFVSAQCPNCPATVRTVHSLAMALSTLDIHIFEIADHPELAKRYNIQSVPTLIIDDKLRYVGTLEKDRLLTILQAGDPKILDQEQIRQLIHTNRAPEAALYIANGEDPAFLSEDLGQSTFQDRLGLLFALEETLEINPRSLDSLIKPLLPYLKAKEASLRGDIADLLGKIGQPEALPELKELKQDPDPEVAEAAREAIEMIVKKKGQP